MRIAVPVASGRLAAHFGHCEDFALLDVDQEKKTIASEDIQDAPPHQPGLLPQWLTEKGVNLVIAGGMGSRALQLFAQHGIKVIVGAPSLEPHKVVASYLAGQLESGANVCDH